MTVCFVLSLAMLGYWMKLVSMLLPSSSQAQYRRFLMSPLLSPNSMQRCRPTSAARIVIFRGFVFATLFGLYRWIYLSLLAICPTPSAQAENLVLDLDGRGDFARLPSNLFEDLTESTVECRVRWKRFNYFSQPFAFGDVWLMLGVNNRGTTGTIQFFIYAPHSHLHTVVASREVELGRWHHLAAVSGPNGMTLYLDGELAGENPFTGSFHSVAPTRVNSLGRSPWLENRDFCGQLDEVRVWSVARTQDQIRSDMRESLRGNEPSLEALWNFDSGNGRDAGPRGHDGILEGDAHCVRADASAAGDAVLNVRVEDLSGQPVPDATVRFFENSELVETLAHDRDGLFPVQFEVRSGSEYSVSATRRTAGDTVRNVPVAPGTTQSIVLSLREAVRLAGRVSAFDGSAHAAVPVDALIRLENEQRWTVAATTVTDADGSFRFVNLLDGAYLVRCHVLDGYVYWGTELRSEWDADGETGPIGRAVTIDAEPSLTRLDFRFANFKKGHWRSLTHLDGLPSNHVTAVAQDKSGLMWFGTDSGLASFDGKLVTVYSTEDGLADEGIGEIYQDREGALWVGTVSGISRFDGNRFVTFSVSDRPGNVSIRAIGQSSDGHLLAGTRAGMARFEGGRFESLDSVFRVDPRYFTGWQGFTTMGIEAARDGVWFGLTAYAEALGALVFLGADRREEVLWKDGLADGILNGMRVDSKGTIWVGTNAGLSSYDRRGIRNWTTDDGLIHNAVNAIARGADDVLWLGTERTGDLMAVGGLTRFDGKRFVHYTEHDGLGGGAVLSVFRDSSGMVWVGTRSGGVFQYDPDSVETFSIEDGLPSNEIQALKRTSDGNLWIGTARSGAAVFDGSQFDRIGAAEGLLHNEVNAFFEDPRGRLWVGTRGGVTRWDGSRLGAFPIPEIAKVNAIGMDRKGTVWISASDHSQWGVLLRSGNGGFDVFQKRMGKADGILALRQGDRDELWFGSGGNGVRLYDGDSFRALPDAGLLKGIGVRAMCFGVSTGMWVATAEELLQFTGTELAGRWRIDSISDRLSTSLFVDRTGRCWFGTSGGARLFDRSALSRLEPVDGISGHRVAAIARGERDGDVYLATDNGLTRYRRATRPPGIRIVSVKASELRGRSIDGFEVPTGDRVTIEFSAIDFKTHSSKRQYRRRLASPLDPSESTPVITGESTFDFMASAPGRYLFEVEAIDRDLNYSAPARLVFSAFLPWYRNAWIAGPIVATGSIGLLLAGTLLARRLARRRIAHLEKQHTAQQAFSRQLIASQELERKRIAAEIHDSLGQNLLVIKNLALLGQTSAKEAESATERFSEMSDLASETIREMRSLAYALRPFELDRLGLAKAIEVAAEKVADSAGFKIETAIDAIDGVLSGELEMALYRIVQEGLNNILKHSKATWALLEITREPAALHLRIQDNGSGFEGDGKVATRPEGLGFQGMEERARMLNGELKVESVRGKGTVIQLRVPIEPGP